MYSFQFPVVVNQGDVVATDIATAWDGVIPGSGTGPQPTDGIVRTVAAVIEIQGGSAVPPGTYQVSIQSNEVEGPGGYLAIRVNQTA